MNTKRNAVLFDLDGTLWDSSAEVLLCWNKVLAPYGRHISCQELSGLMGYTPREIGDAQFPDLQPNERYVLTDKCLSEEAPYLNIRGAKLYPRVRETLRILSKHFFIGLVSNCTEPYALSFLHSHGLESLFNDFETAGNTGLDKGENIILVLKRNKIENAVYVGDTRKDLDAAAYAKIPFIYASWGFGNLENSNHPALKDFSGLITAVFSVLDA